MIDGCAQLETGLDADSEGLLNLNAPGTVHEQYKLVQVAVTMRDGNGNHCCQSEVAGSLLNVDGQRCKESDGTFGSDCSGR